MQKRAIPTVSFIIPTLNAGHILRRCLTAIRRQEYPKNKIEIIVADAGSKDDTVAIAKKFGALIIRNPEILHEPGKSRAAKVATGEILFYIDADNILATTTWIGDMVEPYRHETNVVGFLPLTVPPSDTHPLDRYLGYLFTDPFTWFIYGQSATPQFLSRRYTPIKKTASYTLYKFPKDNPPIFGLSQGVGTTKTFERTGDAYADDMLAGIKLIAEGGLIAFVPKAGVYHYHVRTVSEFVAKYRWRIRNNIQQKVKGMGLRNRWSHIPVSRKIRTLLFLPYGLTLIGPIIDALILVRTHRDIVMLWHIPAVLILCGIILTEGITNLLPHAPEPGTYGKA